MPTATGHQPATAPAERDEYGRGVPLHVEAALREYLKCGILAG